MSLDWCYSDPWSEASLPNFFKKKRKRKKKVGNNSIELFSYSDISLSPFLPFPFSSFLAFFPFFPSDSIYCKCYFVFHQKYHLLCEFHSFNCQTLPALCTEVTYSDNHSTPYQLLPVLIVAYSVSPTL